MSLSVHKSAEDYLEAILLIKQKKRMRSFYRHSKSSRFFKAKRKRCHEKAKRKRLHSYGQRGLYHPYRKRNEYCAEKFLKKHNYIAELLISLGVSEETAYEDSCKIEHDISEESFMALKKAIGNFSR